MNALLFVTVLAIASWSAQAEDPCVKSEKCFCERQDGKVVDLRSLGNFVFNITDKEGKWNYAYSPCGTVNKGTNCTKVAACEFNQLLEEVHSLGKPEQAQFLMVDTTLAIKYTDGERSMLVTLVCSQTSANNFTYVSDKDGAYNFTLETPAACESTDTTTTKASTATTKASTATTKASTATTKASTATTKASTATTKAPNATTTATTNATVTTATTNATATTKSSAPTSTTKNTATSTPQSNSTITVTPASSTRGSNTTIKTTHTTGGASSASSMALISLIFLAVLARMWH